MGVKYRYRKIGRKNTYIKIGSERYDIGQVVKDRE
jgi:hypothetical protein